LDKNKLGGCTLTCFLVRAKTALYLSITLEGYMFHKAEGVRLTARSLSTANKQATADPLPARYGPGHKGNICKACLPAAICSVDAHVPSMDRTRAEGSPALPAPQAGQHARGGKSEDGNLEGQHLDPACALGCTGRHTADLITQSGNLSEFRSA